MPAAGGVTIAILKRPEVVAACATSGRGLFRQPIVCIPVIDKTALLRRWWEIRAVRCNRPPSFGSSNRRIRVSAGRIQAAATRGPHKTDSHTRRSCRTALKLKLTDHPLIEHRHHMAIGKFVNALAKPVQVVFPGHAGRGVAEAGRAGVTVVKVGQRSIVDRVDPAVGQQGRGHILTIDQFIGRVQVCFYVTRAVRRFTAVIFPVARNTSVDRSSGYNTRQWLSASSLYRI